MDQFSATCVFFGDRGTHWSLSVEKFCGVQFFLCAAFGYVLKSLDEASLVFFFEATFSSVSLLIAVLSCCQVASWSGPECDVVLGSCSLKPHSETYSSRGSTWTSSATCRGFCLSAETLQNAAVFVSNVRAQSRSVGCLAFSASSVGFVGKEDHSTGEMGNNMQL